MLVQIEKCGKYLTVSKGTFENSFKHFGYKIVGEAETKQIETEDVVEDVQEAVAEEAEEEIPISDMTKQQLAQFAKDYNIDLSGAKGKTINDVRKYIQKCVREQNME